MLHITQGCIIGSCGSQFRVLDHLSRVRACDLARGPVRRRPVLRDEQREAPPARARGGSSFASASATRQSFAPSRRIKSRTGLPGAQVSARYQVSAAHRNQPGMYTTECYRSCCTGAPSAYAAAGAGERAMPKQPRQFVSPLGVLMPSPNQTLPLALMSPRPVPVAAVAAIQHAQLAARPHGVWGTPRW